MIFGRKKTQKDSNYSAESTEIEDSQDLEDPIVEGDEWSGLDQEDARDDGPFDITEVDLDADDVERVDLGAVIITPFEDMQLQLQIDEDTQRVPAMLVTHKDSGLEVALFAAPKSSSILAEVRQDVLSNTKASKGTAEVVEGPFGAEIRRVLPVSGPKDEQFVHISRIWYAQGPRWLLRGTIMGEAAQEYGVDDKTLPLYEFFANLVVRRGNDPLAAGDSIAMTLPDGDYK